MGNFKLRKGKGNKNSYNPFQQKGLISPVHNDNEPVRVNLPESDEAEGYRVDQIGEVKKARQAAARRFNETEAGRALWDTYQSTLVHESSKPDVRGTVGIWNPETQKESSWKRTTKKASKENKAAYHDALNRALKTDTQYQGDKELIRKGTKTGGGISFDPDELMS